MTARIANDAEGGVSRRRYDIACPRVAFQGEFGAYSDEAIIQHWNGLATAIPSTSFEHVVAHVTTGFADLGVVPVWNSVVGVIHAGVAAIRAGEHRPFATRVIGDVHLRVHHQLLGVTGSSVADLHTVASHPVALAQCARFLGNHPHISAVESFDTAGSAQELARVGSRTHGAIAGRLAATRYGLVVLQPDIEDDPRNVTQFRILERTMDSHSIAPSTGPMRW